MAKRTKKVKTAPEPDYSEFTNTTPELPKSGNAYAKYVGGAIVLLIALAYFGRGWYLAALVNNQPIFTFQVNKTLNARFGSQTIESMINESLIADAARKANVAVTKEEIEAKEQEILQGLGPDVKLEDILKYQGITKADFDKQISLEITVKKIVGKDIQLTDADVEQYIASNQATLVSTDPAALKAEARQALLDQQIAQKVQTWFSELRAKAKIVKF